MPDYLSKDAVRKYPKPERRTEDPLNDDLCELISNVKTTKERQRAVNIYDSHLV